MNRTSIFTLLFTISFITQAQDINDSLVAYYPFSGSAENSVSNSYHGTVSGATLGDDRLGRSNSAYYFDGTNDYIEVLNSQNMIPANGSMSISVWFKTDDLRIQNLVGKSVDHLGDFQVYQDWALKLIYSGNGAQMGGHVNSATVNPNTSTSYFTAARTDTKYNTSDWFHLVMTWDEDSLRLYVNGVLDSTKSEDTGFDLSTRFNLNIGGSSQLASIKPDRYFKGAIDEVRVYNRALNLNDVREIAAADSADVYSCDDKSLDDFLLAYYPFNGDANNEVVNKYHGTVSGATLTTNRQGLGNSAYYFDGTNDYIEILNSKDMIPADGPVSVSVWFKTDEYKIQNLVGKSVDHLGDFNLYQDWACKLIYSSNGAQYGCHVNSNEINTSTGVVYHKAVRSMASFDTMNWHNYTFTWDKDTLTTYVDGVLDSVAVSSDNFLLSTRFNLNIGGSSDLASLKPDRYFSGKIDEVRIYSRVLCPEEILEIMSYDSATVGIESRQINRAPNLIVYPNPSTSGKSALHFHTNSVIEQVEMLSIEGRKVSTQFLGNNLKYDAGAGTYILKIQIDNNWYFRKIILN